VHSKELFFLLHWSILQFIFYYSDYIFNFFCFIYIFFNFTYFLIPNLYLFSIFSYFFRRYIFIFIDYFCFNDIFHFEFDYDLHYFLYCFMDPNSRNEKHHSMLNFLFFLSLLLLLHFLCYNMDIWIYLFLHNQA